jgi:hypothetical protein
VTRATQQAAQYAAEALEQELSDELEALSLAISMLANRASDDCVCRLRRLAGRIDDVRVAAWDECGLGDNQR